MTDNLDVIKARRDAFSAAFALVLRTGEPGSDRADKYLAAQRALVDAAMESARDVPWLTDEVTRLTAERDKAQRDYEAANRSAVQYSEWLEEERASTQPLLAALRVWYEEYRQALGPVGQDEMVDHNLTLAHALERYEREASTDG